VIIMFKKIISLVLMTSMLMCSPIVFANDIGLSDIDGSHWAYEAISQLVSEKTVNGYPDGTFRPNGTVTFAEFEKMITGEWKNNPEPIDREAALDLLWQHNGKPENYSAPGIITNQMENKNAAAWGYTTGLMQGNDGLNLRPEDTLTRAEAATLIVRAKTVNANAKSFAEAVSDDILKTVWDVYNIFDSEYSATETVSADELLKATIALGNLRNSNLTVTSATVEDAAVLLLYASTIQSENTVKADSLEGVTDKYGKIAQIAAARGFENGVILPNEASSVATKRDIALILIQIDELNGKGGFKINKDLSQYPANVADFAYITEGIPTAVYTTSFDNSKKPAEMYNFVSTYSSIFKVFLAEMEGKFDGKAKFTLIPTLVCQDVNGAVLRVKCTLGNDVKADQLFGAGYENAGSEFYMDINTGFPVVNVYIPTSTAKIGKFICNN